MYEILFCSNLISHKKTEIKVNNFTPDYAQNFIYPLVVFKFDPKEPKYFIKARTCLGFHKECTFYCLLSYLH